MKLFFKSKDGGSESKVTGYWLIEWKSVFSIVLLRFDKGSREAYHNHAFNAVSWVLSGQLTEDVLYPKPQILTLAASIKPVITQKYRCHKVSGVTDKTWVLSLRGPWQDTWNEYFNNRTKTTLTHNRLILQTESLK